MIEHSNRFMTTLPIAVTHSRIVATSEIKCKNWPKSSLMIRINVHESNDGFWAQKSSDNSG